MANNIEEKLKKQIRENQEITEALKKMLDELDKKRIKKRGKLD
jgi:hypothetical protein